MAALNFTFDDKEFAICAVNGIVPNNFLWEVSLIDLVPHPKKNKNLGLLSNFLKRLKK